MFHFKILTVYSPSYHPKQKSEYKVTHKGTWCQSQWRRTLVPLRASWHTSSPMCQVPSRQHNLFSFATSWNPNSYAGILWAKLVQSYVLFQELYRKENAGFTKCPAGTVAHDWGLASWACGSHIVQHYRVKRGGGDLVACDWQVMHTRTLRGVRVKRRKLHFPWNASLLQYRYFWLYRLRPYSCDI